MKLKPYNSYSIRTKIAIYSTILYLIGFIIMLSADWVSPVDIYEHFFRWIIFPLYIFAWIDLFFSLLKAVAESHLTKTKDIRINPFTRLLLFVGIVIFCKLFSWFWHYKIWLPNFHLFYGHFNTAPYWYHIISWYNELIELYLCEISIGVIEIVSIIGRIRLHFQLKEEKEEQERIEREKEEAMLNKMKQKTTRRKPRKTKVVKKPYFDDDFDDDLPSNWSVTIE